MLLLSLLTNLYWACVSESRQTLSLFVCGTLIGNTFLWVRMSKDVIDTALERKVLASALIVSAPFRRSREPNHFLGSERRACYCFGREANESGQRDNQSLDGGNVLNPCLMYTTVNLCLHGQYDRAEAFSTIARRI